MWLLAGGGQLGLAAVESADRGSAGLIGSGWVAAGAVQLLAFAWSRRNADRLDAAWHDARADAAASTANASTDKTR